MSRAVRAAADGRAARRSGFATCARREPPPSAPHDCFGREVFDGCAGDRPPTIDARIPRPQAGVRRPAQPGAARTWWHRVLRATAGALALADLAACGGGGSPAVGPPPPPPPVVAGARAVWLDPATIVWPGADATHAYRLFYSANARLAAVAGGVSGADNPAGDLLAPGALTNAEQARFPQYAASTALALPPATASVAATLVRGQLLLVEYSGADAIGGTAVQTAPLLDALYAAAAQSVALGVSFDPVTDVPSFRVWAPTAGAVKLNVYASATASSATSYDMTLDPASGVYGFTAPDASWTNGAYYTYAVQVYTRRASSPSSAFGALVTNTVADPYATSLSGNGQRAMVLNLSDATMRPPGWPGAVIPTAAVPTDSVIYELHVRDFSANDPTVPAAHAGKYLAFTDLSSNGVAHLAALAAAGLTHVHLLPVFDFSSVDELNCQTPVIPASTGAGTEAETAVKATQNSDCYNWGYDPRHYGAPAGVYSSNPSDGLARVRELRQMVAALHRLGLRVVMDVVYNHTSASGQAANSVLDQIVPDYYHRLNAAGEVESHSCCADTATEHALMEKLMTDTLLRWADQYQVDGFRFDVMGMIPKSVMVRSLAAVEAVAAGDGRGHTYFYGEGWTPDPEVAAVITPASQLQLAGSGIGTFNDRIRDAVRGGGPGDSGATLVARQGFIDGLCYAPTASDSADCSGGATDLGFLLQNRISVGLAGNLASFPLNAKLTGAGIDYYGSPTGYTASPAENIAYASVHDNETLFDIAEYKHAPGTSAADAARAHAVGLSLIVLAQGVPFVHGGDDLLRSKSGDSNSYDSGDYFNRIFWDASANGWAAGLPPDTTGNNAANAATLGPLLNSRPAPDTTAMLRSGEQFREALRMRRATDLFRLTAAADINRCVGFPDQGAQAHGLIVERILGSGCVAATTSGYRSVVILYNASTAAQTVSLAAYAGKASGTTPGAVSLHPAQLGGSDPVLLAGWRFASDAAAGHFTVPARTTAVFVEYL
jgi:pullulanase